MVVSYTESVHYFAPFEGDQLLVEKTIETNNFVI